MSKQKQDFDERQVLERGKACRNAYITALLALFACVLTDQFAGFPFRIEESLSLVCFTSASAFMMTAVLKDAVEGINTRTAFKSMSVCFLIAGIALAIFGIFDYVGFLTELDKALDSLISAIVGGISFACVFVVYWVHQSKLRKMDKE